jgi:hypothetical protein
LGSGQVDENREVTIQQITKENLIKVTANTLVFTLSEAGNQWKIMSKGNITGLKI